ncbi:MAG: DNA repair protein RecN [Bacteroidales bacterium]|nr:DNA repair protein RecN [Bacteroidales bacterium]
MIETLSISNYALIDNIELTFQPGLNIITGETGAGKSIMLGALSMLFGNRADTRVVSDKSKKSVVEGIFDITGYDEIGRLLADNDIDPLDRQLILRREISPAGRSRSFVNDAPAPLSLLREIAIRLVDLHSQHQNLLLADNEYQLNVIDTMLDDKSVKTEYAAAYETFRSALKKYQVAKRAADTSKAEEEYLRYQLQLLEQLNLQPGEQESLEQERSLLANVSTLKDSLTRVIALFDGSEENIISMLRQSEGLLDDIEELPEARQLGERIESLRIEAVDIKDTVETLDGRLEADPRRLEYVEERLSDIYELQHKLSVDSEAALIALRQELSERIDSIDNSDERIRQYATKAKIAKKQAMELAERLTEARRKVADRFAGELLASATPLGMKNLRAEIEITPAELSATGADRVNFLFAFNKNQALMPVKDTASGGEISRLMLSVKALVAKHIQLPSIIFDEVDTGVSGDVAGRMGQLMKDISRRIQVIAITHLPPVASKGDVHFKVFKEDSDTATNTRVRRLSDEQRIDELALMLSGDTANEAARDTARSLLSGNNKL